MSAITQCPECGTRFRVSQEQLEAHQGMVRCGRCQTAFNAQEHLHDDEPSPQLSLPIAPEEEQTVATPLAETITTAKSVAPADTAEPPGTPRTAAGEDHYFSLDLSVPEHDSVSPDEAEEVLAATMKNRPAWPWAAAAGVLLLLLLAQAAYFFRIELAARMPGLKPALAGYCSALGCSVPMPQNADLMSIETSDLEADPAHPNLITLTATLRNKSPHAPYTQAYPDLELTLLDINDTPMARRIFRPAEYLRHAGDEKLGLGANRESDIKLNLDTTDLKPSGYRLLLFYPA